jgi:phenylalanine-4-hydroxylase
MKPIVSFLHYFTSNKVHIALESLQMLRKLFEVSKWQTFLFSYYSIEKEAELPEAALGFFYPFKATFAILCYEMSCVFYLVAMLI